MRVRLYLSFQISNLCIFIICKTMRPLLALGLAAFAQLVTSLNVQSVLLGKRYPGFTFSATASHSFPECSFSNATVSKTYSVTNFPVPSLEVVSFFNDTTYTQEQVYWSQQQPTTQSACRFSAQNVDEILAAMQEIARSGCPFAAKSGWACSFCCCFEYPGWYDH